MLIFEHNDSNQVRLKHLCIKDYKKALYWNNLQLNSFTKDYVEDAYNLAKIMNLIIHYELGNFELMPYLIRSTYRQLNKSHSPNSIELIMLDFIKNALLNTKNRNEFSLHLIKLKANLNKLNNNKYKARMLNQIDLSTWINNKLKVL